jgi:hypothetical protein
LGRGVTKLNRIGADSEEEHESVSDIDIAEVDSLKRLTPSAAVLLPWSGAIRIGCGYCATCIHGLYGDFAASVGAGPRIAAGASPARARANVGGWGGRRDP